MANTQDLLVNLLRQLLPEPDAPYGVGVGEPSGFDIRMLFPTAPIWFDGKPNPFFQGTWANPPGARMSQPYQELANPYRK